MKIGIMQPYFMPYIGYWQLISAVDQFVLLDDVNYIKRGWINRNKILVNGHPKLFSLPIAKASQNRFIMDTKLAFYEREKEKLLKTVALAYKKAPYFTESYTLLQKIVRNKEEDLTEYIAESIREVMHYLQMDTVLIKSSEIKKNNHLRAQDKIIEICKLLGADEYYNAIGGVGLYDAEAFKEQGIRLRFVSTEEICYKQFGNEFEKNLSVIDVMMFLPVKEIKKILCQYALLQRGEL